MRILIEDLTFKTILGILPHERTTPQRVRIDCTVDYVYSDEQFINYADISADIIQIMDNARFELIETALNVLASTLKEHFPLIDALDLSIRKPDILPHCTVGVRHRFIFNS